MAERPTTRKLAAILAADVAGYTRLMGADESGTLASLKAHRAALIDPLIAEHCGRIVKTTGDGLLLEFPSVVDAVACAIAIQIGMAERNSNLPAERRMLFRIGVNIGDVIVEDNDVFGDGVNLAARLEQIAEPGGICLSEDAARQVRGKVDATIVDNGSRKLKNIAGRVRVYRTAASGSASYRPRRGIPRRYCLSAFAVLLVAAIASAGAFVGLRWDSVPSHKLATVGKSFAVVAVLPFANQTGDPSQEYLSDGVTDELIAAIGRFHDLRVIDHNAVASYKGGSAPHDQIVADLGARYLVEGSVRRDNRRLRIAARLTDADDGAVLWTDRYDGTLADFLDFQETIARQIAGKLAVNISQLEVRRRTAVPRPNLDAYDLVLRARALGLGTSRQKNREVRALATRAIEQDTGYSSAYALLAEAILTQIVLGWTEFTDREFAHGEELARRAIAISPNVPDGHRALGRFLALRGRYDEALRVLRRAIDINPSDTAATAVWGTVLSYTGDFVGAIEALELALRFNPALDAIYVFDLSASYYLTRRYDDALRIVERQLARNPDIAIFDVIGAAAAGRLGRIAAAKRYAEKVRDRMPNLDVSNLGSRYPDRRYGDDIRAGLELAGIGRNDGAKPN